LRNEKKKVDRNYNFRGRGNHCVWSREKNHARRKMLERREKQKRREKRDFFFLATRKKRTS